MSRSRQLDGTYAELFWGLMEKMNWSNCLVLHSASRTQSLIPTGIPRDRTVIQTDLFLDLEGTWSALASAGKLDASLSSVSGNLAMRRKSQSTSY